MDKYAYIVDSSCFLDKEEVESFGFFFLPLRCSFEGEDYLEGINLNREELKKAIEEKRDVKTSQPTPGDVIELINNLKTLGYKKAVFACIGSGLSATGVNVAAIAENEDFHIVVFDTYGVGPQQVSNLVKIREYIENDNKTPEEAIDIVRPQVNDILTYLLVDDLFHLSRGGRITPAAAAFGNMLKIKPVLSLETKDKGGIDVVGKIRTVKKAAKKMAKMAVEGKNLDEYRVLVANFYGGELVEELKDGLLEIDPDLEIEEYELTSVIGVHTGLKSVGVQLIPK